MVAYVASDDAYGGFDLQFQGADLNLFNSGIVNAQNGYNVGAVVQDPAGWLQKYYRPNPQSTAGYYYSILTTMGYQGTTWPFVPTTIVRLRLESSSTQEKATVAIQTGVVAITDRKQFIRSMREVMGANIIQDIDPAILNAGLQEVTAKGWAEKTGGKPQ